MLGTYRSAKAWIADTFEPLQPVYDAWMRVISAFSWVLVRIGLTLTFFTGFLVYGIVLRLVRKDPMTRALDRDATTYWTENVIEVDDLEDFRRLY